MSKYLEEINFFKKNNDFKKYRDKISNQQLEKIISYYPNAPIEFLDFLMEVGGGQFKNSQYEFKNFLFDLSDIGLSDVYDVPPNIVFFGDNLMGDFVGFDLSSEKKMVVELNHQSGKVTDTGLSFRDFFRMQIGLK